MDLLLVNYEAFTSSALVLLGHLPLKGKAEVAAEQSLPSFRCENVYRRMFSVGENNFVCATFVFV